MTHRRIHIKCTMSSAMQQIRENKWDSVRDQLKTFMVIETIASISHRLSIVPNIVGAKEVFIFFNYEVPLRKFSKKYILSLSIWAWYRKKWWVLKSNSHLKNYSKIIKKLNKKFLPPLYKRNGFFNFFQNLFSTLYNIYFSHEDRLSRFQEN